MVHRHLVLKALLEFMITSVQLNLPVISDSLEVGWSTLTDDSVLRTRRASRLEAGVVMLGASRHQLGGVAYNWYVLSYNIGDVHLAAGVVLLASEGCSQTFAHGLVVLGGRHRLSLE